MVLILNLSNPKIKNLHTKKLVQGCKTWQVITIYFCRSIQIYGLMVKTSHSDSGDTGLNPAGWCNSLPPHCHFAWYWACQWTNTFTFYIAVLSKVDFLLWISSVAILQGFTLNMSIWLPLFWSTWSWALGPDFAMSVGLANGQWR